MSAERVLLETVVRNNDPFIAKLKLLAEIIILDEDLVSVSTTLDTTTSISYTHGMTTLEEAARSACRDLDPSNDMMYLRMGTTKREFLIGSDPEGAFTIITMQLLKGTK